MGFDPIGWLASPFSSSTSSSQPPSVREKSKDGGYVAPDRNERELCYESRDLFFDCLDRHDILDAIKEDDEARRNCSNEVKEFERDCARSWIKYFKEKRVMEYNRDATIEKIKKDDAAMAAKAKAEKKKSGGGGLFS